MDNKKINNIYHSPSPPLILKIKISEIFPFKEELQNTISEYSLKFEGMNNNKFNIYNLSYILKNTIDLIPTNSTSLNSIIIYLIKNNQFISKGILNINKNISDQTVKFKIINKNLNVKFSYTLSEIDITNNNNNNGANNINSKNKLVVIKKKHISKTKLFVKHKTRRLNNNKLHNNNSIIAQKINKINFRNIRNSSILNKMHKHNNHNSCLEFGIYSPKTNSSYEILKNKNMNLKQKTFSHHSTFDNKDHIDKNNSKKRFKKCLSARNIKSCNIFNKSLLYKRIHNSKHGKVSSDLSFDNKKNVNFNFYKFIKNRIFTTDEDLISNTINKNDISNKNIISSNSKDSKSNIFSTNLVKKKTNKKFETNRPNSKKNIKNKLFKRTDKIDDVFNDKDYFLLTTKKNEDYNNMTDRLTEEYIDNKKLFNVVLSPQIYEKERYNNNVKFQRRYNSGDSLNISNNDSNSNNLYENKNSVLGSLLNTEKEKELYTIKINTINNRNKEKTNISRCRNKFKENYRESKIEYINQNDILNKINLEQDGCGNTLENNKNEDNPLEKFIKLKEEFNLLYNKNYLDDIQDELLKLEIELLVEKIIELISEYHKNISEEKIIYKDLLLLKKNCKNKYFNLKKLNKKLQLIKEKKDETIDNNDIKNNCQISERKDLIIFRTEIDLFQILFKNSKKVYENNFCLNKMNSKAISKMLKNILIKILEKKNHRELISNVEKYKKWISDNISEDILNNLNYNIIDNISKSKNKNIKINYNIEQ